MAKLSYHQRKYPQLYAGGPGGISDILLSDAQYEGPKTYPGATGEGFDPLGLMKPGGKGTGLDLTIPVKKKEKKKKNNRPTGPSSGMTIPSSAYMEDEDDLLARMSALDMMQPNAMGGKITTEKNEDDRPKGLFGFLDGVELDGDALIKAGRAIEKGEGLGGAIEAYNTEMKSNQAAEVAKQEKEYDRARQEQLDKLDFAVKMNEIDYKQSMMKPEDVKIAEQAAIAEAASKKIKPGTFEFAEILSDKLDMIINKEKPMTSAKFMDNMTLDQLVNTFQNPDGKGAAGNSANQDLVDGTGLMQE